MNKNANVILRYVAIALLAVMMLSMISCEQIEGIIGGITGSGNQGENGENGENGEGGGCDGAPEECQHEEIVDGVCGSCQESFFVKFDGLNLTDIYGENAPNGISSSKIFYTKGTVKEIINDKTGEMIITDETGDI